MTSIATEHNTVLLVSNGMSSICFPAIFYSPTLLQNVNIFFCVNYVPIKMKFLKRLQDFSVCL